LGEGAGGNLFRINSCNHALLPIWTVVERILTQIYRPAETVAGNEAAEGQGLIDELERLLICAVHGLASSWLRLAQKRFDESLSEI
jgi:hypothetical protein